MDMSTTFPFNGDEGLRKYIVTPVLFPDAGLTP
jgi:hypothetical protein